MHVLHFHGWLCPPGGNQQHQGASQQNTAAAQEVQVQFRFLIGLATATRGRSGPAVLLCTSVASLIGRYNRGVVEVSLCRPAAVLACSHCATLRLH